MYGFSQKYSQLGNFSSHPTARHCNNYNSKCNAPLSKTHTVLHQVELILNLWFYKSPCLHTNKNNNTNNNKPYQHHTLYAQQFNLPTVIVVQGKINLAGVACLSQPGRQGGPTTTGRTLHSLTPYTVFAHSQYSCHSHLTGTAFSRILLSILIFSK